ncbi:related to DNA repair protein Nse1 [Ramularia collo-cygni]|uniref:Non-structural maintenance of chromosomes element 1 homolog n=1 Tax=Ramularia collo-cygni TaxID=112498 RepID=A0A2D3V0B4_9PEZI|nr:related to DNA repair protein Nse1 [Ramularia collo-cygni]CZT15904.1 related to DNA repair protein Nse1 [Ramularia collo-cygni]
MSRADGPSDGGYGNKHRAFLQALFSRQTIILDEAKPIIANIETCENPDRPIASEDVDQTDFENYIYSINNEISPFDYEIRSSIHQTSRERVYALINTTSDALTQMSTIHTADEIAFVKRVLDAMFDTHNTPRAEVMAVTSMQALKLSKDPHRRETQTQSAQGGLTMSQAEKVLADMVLEGWFEQSENGYYSLSPRALMELRSWLVHTYNEAPEDVDEGDEEPHERVKSCELCQDIVTVGQRCPNLPCNARLHNHCVRNMFRAQRESEKCPTCSTNWKDAPPVGEEAAPRGSGGARRPVNGTGPRRSTNEPAVRRSAVIEMEDDEDESDAGIESE